MNKTTFLFVKHVQRKATGVGLSALCSKPCSDSDIFLLIDRLIPGHDVLNLSKDRKHSLRHASYYNTDVLLKYAER